MAMVPWKPQAKHAIATGEVSLHSTDEPKTKKINTKIPDTETPPRARYRMTIEEVADEDSEPVYSINKEPEDVKITKHPMVVLDTDESIYTRATKPFLDKQVAKIVELVTIGDDLTEEEHTTVVVLIEEFTDCFALSVSEVKTVKGSEHKLDIKPGSKFATKITNRPFTPPQQKYLNKVLDELLDMAMIRSIAVEDVKCCSQITLAQKAHMNNGLTITELKHQVNDQCVEAGLPTAHDLLPREEQLQDTTADIPTEPKWRFCMNFAELNKATAVRPCPKEISERCNTTSAENNGSRSSTSHQGSMLVQWLRRANHTQHSIRVEGGI